MRSLLFSTFKDVCRRRPDWSTTNKPANAWFWIDAQTIGVNGNSSGLVLHYLEAPMPLTSMSDTTDERLDRINEMAMVHLMVAYACQIAGDAASLQRAQVHFAQGMRLAGVNERVRMIRPKEAGGETANA